MGRPPTPWQDRFDAIVVRGAPDECWPWPGYVSAEGYGQFRITKLVGAHVASYLRAGGEIPDGYEVDHVKARGCTRTDCVNPAHLEPVPGEVNRARAYDRERCRNGHKRAEVGVYADGRCAACGRERARAAYRRAHPRMS